MPLPKRRHSKSRRNKKRTHYKIDSPSISICPQCMETKPPHRACPHCGFYRGRAVVETKEG